jgi:hypothetical protein
VKPWRVQAITRNVPPHSGHALIGPLRVLLALRANRPRRVPALLDVDKVN